MRSKAPELSSVAIRCPAKKSEANSRKREQNSGIRHLRSGQVGLNMVWFTPFMLYLDWVWLEVRLNQVVHRVVLG